MSVDSPESKAEFERIMVDYADVFVEPKERVDRPVNHRIEVYPDSKPYSRKPYRLSDAEAQELKA